MDGLSTGSPPRIFWNSRRKSAKGRSNTLEPVKETTPKPTNEKIDKDPMKTDELAPESESKEENMTETKAELSEKRKALFEPLEPAGTKRRISTTEELLPPPDFDSMVYPNGWLNGKKRKLVNVDVVESMRRIAVQEINRKDREIGGLNEQLEEDSRALEHLQLQLVEEKRKRSEAERENQMLQDQISVLMTMLDENQPMDEEDDEGNQMPFDDDDENPPV
ncbi:hypothetical protein LUZ60_000807 [Juncus effusus]|nr:hypothetical protein LUZ60_000807 [Juncus effusus]